MAKNWDMIRLFESINKTKVKGSLIKESFESEQEFSDNEQGINPPNPTNDYTDILNSYLETALWADAEEGNADFEGKTIHDIDPQSKAEALKDIQQFVKLAGEQAPEELKTYSDEQLGHNLWLSRNGHGAGFFDDNNDKLQDIARNMKGRYIYAGDDHNIYIHESKPELKEMDVADDYDSYIEGRQNKRRELPFANIVQYFKHYDLDVTKMNPDVVREVYVKWEDEADYDGVSDVEENEDGTVNVELDGVYGRHWISFKSNEEFDKYYKENILADARAAFERMYKHYEKIANDKQKQADYEKTTTNTLGNTHGNVLATLKSKMNMKEEDKLPHLRGKRVVLARDLKKGQRIVGLGKGLLVMQDAVSLVNTPSGKVEIVVQYPNGVNHQKIWNKNTGIQIYDDQQPVVDTNEEDGHEQDYQAMMKMNSTDIDANKPDNVVPKKRMKSHTPQNYHNTQAEALEDAEKMAQSKGYEIDYPQHNWAEHVGYGQTQRYTLDLKKDGIPVKNRKLLIILYRMDNGKYELTTYIA